MYSHKKVTLDENPSQDRAQVVNQKTIDKTGSKRQGNAHSRTHTHARACTPPLLSLSLSLSHTHTHTHYPNQAEYISGRQNSTQIQQTVVQQKPSKKHITRTVSTDKHSTMLVHRTTRPPLHIMLTSPPIVLVYQKQTFASVSFVH